MSTLLVKICNIDKISEHPNADRLEIATVGGWEVCVSKGQFKQGDLVVHIPPDAILPAELHSFLGVSKYCKSFPKNTNEYRLNKRRVTAAKIRGVSSFGILLPLSSIVEYTGIENLTTINVDIKDLLGITKYEPTPRATGNALPNHPYFHKYTDIEHFRNFPNIIKDGEHVVITEKIHGTLFRCGIIDDGAPTLVAGSKNVRCDEGCLYWFPMKQLRQLLNDIYIGHKSVIVFGEIYGPKIQDMVYDGELSFSIFDISVDGSYLDWPLVVYLCDYYNVRHVPILYSGPFCKQVLINMTDGPTTVCKEPLSNFKGREGCVVKPIIERRCEVGRVIFKSVSADYLNRKGGTDNA